ncbi:ATP-binding cassette domain-containing protein [Pseudomonas sp. GCM10022186]|uniref:ATP-binding cassette domain-containing protein n=1 Tax=Pseudomonas sp. GCM10022186 TaxID=3252650 RepID=UPI003619B118
MLSLDPRITHAILSRPWRIAQVLAFVSLSKLTLIAAPLLLGHIVDGLTSEQGIASQEISLLVLVFCVAGVMQVVINPIQSLYLSRLVQECVCESSLQWVRCVMGKEFEVFSSMRIGGLINTVDRGVNAYERLLNFMLLSGVPLVVETLIVGGVLLFYGSPGVFFTVLLAAAGYLYLNHRIIHWRRSHIDALNDQEDEVASSFAQTFGAAKAIKCEGTPDSALASLDGAYRGYAAAAIRIGYSASILGSAKALFICLSTAGILLFVFMDQLSAQPFMTVGEMVAMFTIATAFFNSVASVAETHRFTDQFASDQKRFQQVLDLPDFKAGDSAGADNPAVPNRLTLGPVRIQRPEAELLELPNALSLRRGESVAIIGSSGAGKTTLLEALAGVLVESRSNLQLGDSSLGNVGGAAQFSQLRYCPQSPSLLSGPIAEAVLFGQPYDRQKLCEHLDSLGLPKLAAEMDSFEVENQGTNLSGGEVKRLSLLRVLMRPGAFNLFDEPTASLDSSTAEQVWDLLLRSFAGQSLVCVTHDLKSLDRFDRVWVVDGGRLIAAGHWQELAKDERVAAILRYMRRTAAADSGQPVPY